MKSFICILFLSVLSGLYALAINNGATDEAQKTKIMNLLNISSYQFLEIDDKQSENKSLVLVRVRRSSSDKIYKKGCERDLALASTGIGGLAGASIGAAAGAATGSVVPVLGTGIGAFIGNF